MAQNAVAGSIAPFGMAPSIRHHARDYETIRRAEAATFSLEGTRDMD
jgi:hypothetical protein